MSTGDVAGSWEELNSRPTPDWFQRSPFGIFIHWGAYSVPAWAEPIGALGTIEDDRYWFTHNPYAEWYHNTIRIDGSPAQQHHQAEFGGAPYDELLDAWQAEHFDPTAWADLFAAAGADYVVPTTKHHDGITLWDAPETGTRNTVHRGPRRDLIEAISTAVRDRGLRLGLYYSGGLDWHYRPLGVHVTMGSVGGDLRPKDAEYGSYAARHVRDLIDRYHPDILWNDIGWPDETFHFGPDGLGSLFNYFYADNPEGLVNDRWGDTHRDYTTSEYEHGGENETTAVWENCRGIGYSFGYNQVEGPEQYMTGAQIARHLTDVVSRGGHFLLNVGPRADGTLPELQEKALRDLGEWMRVAKPILAEMAPSLGDRVTAGDDDSWVRSMGSDSAGHVFVDSEQGDRALVRLAGDARLEPVAGVKDVSVSDGTATVLLDADRQGPAILRIS
ncbi:alpha-L-fucosidase [Microlunatus panaciterrae]|uniref:alpha-L-fucosidase n=1 Tax=Microlunatus panaciterrae TaxID=400768 RepID=A0ABS2RIJ9_9ACTN|nr:alpha-L-fucosidase [Microlunatus panaciterrae]MBM7798797.1 alpha-L-fucosidase [Microlunatus panaciterrae]